MKIQGESCELSTSWVSGSNIITCSKCAS